MSTMGEAIICPETETEYAYGFAFVANGAKKVWSRTASVGAART